MVKPNQPTNHNNKTHHHKAMIEKYKKTCFLTGIAQMKASYGIYEEGFATKTK